MKSQLHNHFGYCSIHHSHSSVLQYCTSDTCFVCCHTCLLWASHSALCHRLSLIQFEILDIILPHAANSPHCLNRHLPTGNEFPHLASTSHLEIISQHEAPFWTTTPVNPPSLTDRCCLFGAAQCCHLTVLPINEYGKFCDCAHYPNITFTDVTCLEDLFWDAPHIYT